MNEFPGLLNIEMLQKIWELEPGILETPSTDRILAMLYKIQSYCQLEISRSLALTRMLLREMEKSP